MSVRNIQLDYPNTLWSGFCTEVRARKVQDADDLLNEGILERLLSIGSGRPIAYTAQWEDSRIHEYSTFDVELIPSRSLWNVRQDGNIIDDYLSAALDGGRVQMQTPPLPGAMSPLCLYYFHNFPRVWEGDNSPYADSAGPRELHVADNRYLHMVSSWRESRRRHDEIVEVIIDLKVPMVLRHARHSAGDTYFVWRVTDVGPLNIDDPNQ